MSAWEALHSKTHSALLSIAAVPSLGCTLQTHAVDRRAEYCIKVSGNCTCTSQWILLVGFAAAHQLSCFVAASQLLAVRPSSSVRTTGCCRSLQSALPSSIPFTASLVRTSVNQYWLHRLAFRTCRSQAAAVRRVVHVQLSRRSARSLLPTSTWRAERGKVRHVKSRLLTRQAGLLSKPAGRLNRMQQLDS